MSVHFRLWARPTAIHTLRTVLPFYCAVLLRHCLDLLLLLLLLLLLSWSKIYLSLAKSENHIHQVNQRLSHVAGTVSKCYKTSCAEGESYFHPGEKACVSLFDSWVLKERYTFEHRPSSRSVFPSSLPLFALSSPSLSEIEFFGWASYEVKDRPSTSWRYHCDPWC